MSRATKPYRKADVPRDWDVEPAPERASLAVVDGDDADESGPNLLYTVSGTLRLTHDAEPQVLRILDEHPALDSLVKPRLGKLQIRETTISVPRARWGQIHRGLLLVAGLAWEGSVHISCDAWDSCINATGDPPPARRLEPTGRFPTTRRKERPRRK